MLVDRAAGTVGDHQVRQLSAENHVAVLSIDGRREVAVVNVQAHTAEVAYRGQRFVFERPDVFADHGPAAGDGVGRRADARHRARRAGGRRATPSPRATCSAWSRR